MVTPEQREALIELRRHCAEDCNERRADEYVAALDACLILLRQQQEQKNEEKAIALRSCAEDQPASPASTEALPTIEEMCGILNDDASAFLCPTSGSGDSGLF
jgi:hypothetical protein